MACADLVRVDAPGLPADWLNAWLAAIGVTVLLPDVKVSWTDEVVPHAVFWVPEEIELADAIVRALPTPEAFDALVPMGVGRNPTLDQYRAAAKAARDSGDEYLSVRLTDLCSGSDGSLGSGQFDVPAPKGRTMFDGAKSALTSIVSQDEVRDCLRGDCRRIEGNGLGFDARRALSGVVTGGKYIVPVIEALAFFGLTMFPVRATGSRAMQRNWTGGQFERGAFRWFTWGEPLDRWAIDAVLDSPKQVAAQWWQTAPFRPSNAADPTRYLFSERVGG